MVLIVFRILIWIVISVGVISAFARLYVILSTRMLIQPEEKTDARRAAIVFGAGLRRDGTPTAVLRDRVETAVRLYQDGKVEKILMSGDNRFVEYNEPGSMREYAIALGVPAEDIVLDYAGRRTYDTCFRAKAIFGLDQALLVTQQFHLPRAIYTCRSIGMDIVGVPATGRNYRKSSIIYWELREIPATFMSLIENHITHPLPVLGEPEPIFK